MSFRNIKKKIKLKSLKKTDNYIMKLTGYIFNGYLLIRMLGLVA